MCIRDRTYTLQAVSDSVWATEHGDRTGKATIWIHGLLGDDFHRVFCGDGITSGRYTWTFVHTSATQNCEIRINGYSKITSFWDIKIESGNKATDWTPAPEDVNSAINNVNSKFGSYYTKTEYDSKITKTKNDITQSVSTTYQRKDAMGNYYTAAQTDAAIKTRGDDIELKVNGIQIGGVNRFVKSTATKNKYLTATGEIMDGGNYWDLTDYIDVSKWNDYIASGWTNLGNSPATCFYDSNKKFISGVADKSTGVRGSLVVPSNATYMRFSFAHVDTDSLKIEKGTKATDYSPAPEDVDSTINNVKESTNQYITDVSDSLGKTEEKLADLESNTNATLKLCVKEDETGRLKSMIEAIADTINITAKGGLNLTGNRFSVSSTNLTITKDGSMTCKNLSVTGGNINIEADDYQTGKISTHANWYTSSLSPFGLTATGRFNNATYSNSGIEFARNGTSESVIVIGCNSEVDDIGIYANSARITSQLTIPVGYNKLNQRATTSANSIQAFNYAWTINGTGLFILNAGVWTDTTDDYGTTNCAIYVNGACVVANTHRYGESSNSVELDAGATFVYWFVNANNQKVLLQAGSTKTGNKTLTYTVQGLFGLAVT